jgi:hypothetical protein
MKMGLFRRRDHAHPGHLKRPKIETLSKGNKRAYQQLVEQTRRIYNVHSLGERVCGIELMKAAPDIRVFQGSNYLSLMFLYRVLNVYD